MKKYLYHSQIAGQLTLVDDELKKKSDIRKSGRTEYDPYETMTEEEMLIKLKRSREHCEEGKYREADKVVSDLRGKYGL